MSDLSCESARYCKFAVQERHLDTTRRRPGRLLLELLLERNRHLHAASGGAALAEHNLIEKVSIFE